MISFGPTSLNDNRRSDRWRAGIFIFAFLAAGVGLAAKYLTLIEVDTVFGKITDAYPRLAPTVTGRGGDIALPPPPPIPKPEPVANSASAPSGLTAKSVIVKDLGSGAVLFAKDEYTTRPLASLTKLASALVLLDSGLDWSTTTLSANGETFDTFILPGRPYVTLDLWRAALVGSSNRALLSLVDATGLSREQFVSRLNEKARQLGLTATFFTEPTGLDAGNMATASDAALLLSEALRHEEIAKALNLPEYTVRPADASAARTSSQPATGDVHMWNTNWLLLRWVPHRLPELIGGKTGYIPAAGYNFATQVGDGSGHVLSVVVLGADANETRFSEARDLAAWAFGNFVWLAEQ